MRLLSFALFCAHTALHTLFAQNQVREIDSLRRQLPVLATDDQRVNTLNLLASRFLRISGDSTRKYGQQAIQLAITTHDLRAQGEALKTLGTLAMNEGKFEQSKDLYQDALTLFISADYPIGQGQCYNNLGMVANRQEDFVNALIYTNKSLDIKIRIKDSVGIANTYNTLATIYEAQKNYPLALEHYRKTVVLQEKVGTDYRIADAYNNLGRMLLATNSDEALGCLLKAIQIRRKIQDKKGLASSYRNVAEVYAGRLNNFDKATEFAQQAITSYKELHEAVPQAECMTFLADVYTKMAQYDKATPVYQEAAAIVEPIKSFAVLIFAYKGLGETQFALKQYGEATAALEKAMLYVSEQHANNMPQQEQEIAKLLVRVGKESHNKELVNRYEKVLSKK